VTRHYQAGRSFSTYARSDAQPVTVIDAPNEVLLFEFAGKVGPDALTSVTYGGLALTRLAAAAQGSALG
jgi:hypothetical protein